MADRQQLPAAPRGRSESCLGLHRTPCVRRCIGAWGSHWALFELQRPRKALPVLIPASPLWLPFLFSRSAFLCGDVKFPYFVLSVPFFVRRLLSKSAFHSNHPSSFFLTIGTLSATRQILHQIALRVSSELLHECGRRGHAVGRISALRGYEGPCGSARGGRRRGRRCEPDDTGGLLSADGCCRCKGHLILCFCCGQRVANERGACLATAQGGRSPVLLSSFVNAVASPVRNKWLLPRSQQPCERRACIYSAGQGACPCSGCAQRSANERPASFCVSTAAAWLLCC